MRLFNRLVCLLLQIRIGLLGAYIKYIENQSSVCIPKEGNAMYLMFCPAFAALLTIGAIQLRDQFSKLS